MTNSTPIFANWTKPPRRRRLRVMLALQRRIRRCRQCPNSFLEFAFADTSGRRMRQAPVHRKLQAFLSKRRRALVELPRDHGKSTQVCGRLVWELGNQPGLRIILVCAAEHLAVHRGRFLRDAISHNPRVQLVFPTLKPVRPWRVNAFAVERAGQVIGPSVSALGIGGSSTGNRADLLVCDDIVDVKSIYSKAERDRVADDFFNNLLNLLEPEGRFWGLCTPWHADDLNARLKKNGAFALFRQPIRHLQPIWPERWPRTALRQRRQEIGSAAFARGYRLTPFADDEIIIRPHWVQYRDARPEFERVILSVDPAVSAKANADCSALVVLGKAGNIVHCLATVARRVSAPALIDLISTMDAEWKPETIVFESNGAFDAVRELLVRHATFGYKVLGEKQHKSKLARVAAFAVSVQNGTFLLNRDGSQRDLFDQMTTFPFGEQDDLLDAAVTGTTHLLHRAFEPRIWVL